VPYVKYALIVPPSIEDYISLQESIKTRIDRGSNGVDRDDGREPPPE
jgi:hypothetical protein